MYVICILQGPQSQTVYFDFWFVKWRSLIFYIFRLFSENLDLHNCNQTINTILNQCLHCIKTLLFEKSTFFCQDFNPVTKLQFLGFWLLALIFSTKMIEKQSVRYQNIQFDKYIWISEIFLQFLKNLTLKSFHTEQFTSAVKNNFILKI